MLRQSNTAAAHAAGGVIPFQPKTPPKSREPKKRPRPVVMPDRTLLPLAAERRNPARIQPVEIDCPGLEHLGYKVGQVIHVLLTVDLYRGDIVGVSTPCAGGFEMCFGPVIREDAEAVTIRDEHGDEYAIPLDGYEWNRADDGPWIGRVVEVLTPPSTGTAHPHLRLAPPPKKGGK